jgi:hypothetical protein
MARNTVEQAPVILDDHEAFIKLLKGDAVPEIDAQTRKEAALLRDVVLWRDAMENPDEVSEEESERVWQLLQQKIAPPKVKPPPRNLAAIKKKPSWKNPHLFLGMGMAAGLVSVGVGIEALSPLVDALMSRQVVVSSSPLREKKMRIYDSRKVAAPAAYAEQLRQELTPLGLVVGLGREDDAYMVDILSPKGVSPAARQRLQQHSILLDGEGNTFLKLLPE